MLNVSNGYLRNFWVSPDLISFLPHTTFIAYFRFLPIENSLPRGFLFASQHTNPPTITPHSSLTQCLPPPNSPFFLFLKVSHSFRSPPRFQCFLERLSASWTFGRSFLYVSPIGVYRCISSRSIHYIGVGFSSATVSHIPPPCPALSQQLSPQMSGLNTSVKSPPQQHNVPLFI